ncbi:MAG: hypothetical protein ACRYF3_09345 [Janthinobacterium lividum]
MTRTEADGAVAASSHRHAPRLLATLISPALVGFVGIVTFWLVHQALVDDAYITLSYARNLAFHGHWGLLSAVQSNTATAPGWVLLLGGATALVGRPVLALGILHVLIAVLLERSLSGSARRAGLPRWVAPVGALLVGTNPLLLSSVGLETNFLILLLSLLLLTAQAGRPLLYGFVAGAVVLTRMDAGVVVAVVAVGVPAILRRLHVAIPAALVVVVPWMVWSWFRLGSAIPDTLIIKTTVRRWGTRDITNGWQWFIDLYGSRAVLSFLPAAAGIVGFVLLASLRIRMPAPRTGPWIAFGVGGLAHWTALSILVVPPFHWYYGILIGVGSITAAGAAGACATRWRSSHRAGSRAVLAPLAAVTGLAVLAQIVAAGVDDVRLGRPWVLSAIQTNYATPAEYAVMGAGLADLDVGLVDSPGEIGHLAYTCDCVVDAFADPARLWPVILARRDQTSGLARRAFDLNYRHYPKERSPLPTTGRLAYFADADVPTTGVVASWPARTGYILIPGRIVLLESGL